MTTSCRWILCAAEILLLLGLILPVTSDSQTLIPPSTPEPPASTEPFTPSASRAPGDEETTDGGPHVSSTEPDIGIAVNNEVHNETESDNATTVSSIMTTLLSESEITTTELPTSTATPAVTTRAATTSESGVPAEATDDANRRQYDEIFFYDDANRRQYDEIFVYDYTNLRQWGLICALILCIIGFLVLFSGRCRGSSCKRRQRRKYNITGI